MMERMGMSDMQGKAVREAATERRRKGVSNSTVNRQRAAVPPAIAHLVDELARLVQPAVLKSMSRLDSAFSQKPHPIGSAHLCRSLPRGSIASPFHSR